MLNIQIAPALAISLALCACGPNQTSDRNANAAAPAAQTPQPSPQPSQPFAGTQPPEPAGGAGNNAPDLSPPELTPEAERGEKGARNILLSFARAIELEEYGQAWSLLGPEDKKKWSEAEFAAMFADLGKTKVAMPDGRMEGAAGSLYYEAPLTITATDGEGRPVRIEGKAVLRRVNDVDGATPAQLRWHFYRLTLDWTH